MGINPVIVHRGVKLKPSKMKRQEFIKAISPFVPEGSASLIADWLIANPIYLSITKDRVTKLGDFRGKNVDSHIPKVTVNGGLNPYSFLITLLHEFAHAETYKKYGRNHQPHGDEWKSAYYRLMVPYMDGNIFPEPLLRVLRKHMRNPKASSHADLTLVKALAVYDKPKITDTIFLEQLPIGSVFAIRDKKFTKGEKRKSRFLCTELETNRQFTVSAMAEVTVLR
jgi:hypothetical protein